jgi:hypothetical protein
MTLIEQLLFQELASIIQCGRVTRAHALEEFNQSRLSDSLAAGQIPYGFLAQGRCDKQAIRVVVYILEQRHDLFIGAIFQWRIVHAISNCCQSTQEDGDGYGAFAVEFQNDVIIFTGLELHPGTPVGDQLGHGQAVTGGAIHRCFKINTGERMSCDTTTRSVPLIMKVPFSVISGKSPRKMSCLIGSGTSGPASKNRNIKRA